MSPVDRCPVREWATRTPDALALSHSGGTFTYAQLDAEVDACAELLRRHRVEEGGRVAALSFNRWHLVVLFWACARVGAVFAPLNARLTRSELEPLKRRLAPSLLLAERALHDRLPGAAIIEEWFTGAKAPGEDARDHSSMPAADRRFEQGPVLLQPGNACAVLFTSGTTGSPKGAVLSWGALHAAAIASAQNLGASPQQRWLATLPLFHVGGLAMLTRTAIYGAALILHESFDPGRINQAIDEGASHVSLVPTGLQRVLAARETGFPRSLEAVLIGGGPVPPPLMLEAKRRGAPVLQTYGLTEACSQVATERPGDADGSTAGRPLPGLELRVVSLERSPLPAGEVGEIELRGPTLMSGYLDDDAATAAALDGGWLRTRDLGALDPAGRLTVHARRSDLIVSGGENIYPAEVEAVLAAHPAVRDVAVVARPDPHWGQVPCALVVLTDGRELPRLEPWCRQHLAGFKIPRAWLEVQEVPRNATGKIIRAAARALAAQDRVDSTHPTETQWER
jgi:O-succinylbenzoic acid--CoA ligase